MYSFRVAVQGYINLEGIRAREVYSRQGYVNLEGIRAREVCSRQGYVNSEGVRAGEVCSRQGYVNLDSTSWGSVQPSRVCKPKGIYEFRVCLSKFSAGS